VSLEEIDLQTECERRIGFKAKEEMEMMVSPRSELLRNNLRSGDLFRGKRGGLRTRIVLGEDFH